MRAIDVMLLENRAERAHKGGFGVTWNVVAADGEVTFTIC